MNKKSSPGDDRARNVATARVEFEGLVERVEPALAALNRRLVRWVSSTPGLAIAASRPSLSTQRCQAVPIALPDPEPDRGFGKSDRVAFHLVTAGSGIGDGIGGLGGVAGAGAVIGRAGPGRVKSGAVKSRRGGHDSYINSPRVAAIAAKCRNRHETHCQHHRRLSPRQGRALLHPRLPGLLGTALR